MFRKGMDLYFTRHDGQAVTIEDFIVVMEEVSGVDLNQFRRWYKQAGTPVVMVEDDYDPSRQRYTLTIHQTCRDTGPIGKCLFIFRYMGLLDQEGRAIPLYLGDEPVEDEKYYA